MHGIELGLLEQETREEDVGRGECVVEEVALCVCACVWVCVCGGGGDELCAVCVCARLRVFWIVDACLGVCVRAGRACGMLLEYRGLVTRMKGGGSGQAIGGG